MRNGRNLTRQVLAVCCGLSLCFWLFLGAQGTRQAFADGGAPNLAYVAGAAHGVSVIDIAQQHVTKTMAVAGDPQSLLLSLDGRFLYVAQSALGRVAVMATRTGQTICTATVPGHPTLLALGPDGTRLYAAGDQGEGVRVLDPATCAVRQTFKTDGPVYGLAATLFGAGSEIRTQLWVAQSSSLAVFDEQGQQRASIPVAGGPGYLSAPAGYAVYATTRQGSVVAVDYATQQVYPLLAGGDFGPMDYDAITGEIYVPDRQHHQLDVLTPLSSSGSQLPREPSRVIRLSDAPQAVAITSDGQLGFVALSSGGVAMLDIPGRQLVTTIPVGGTPHFIITGLYPPVVGTTPQDASVWRTWLPIVAYALVFAMCIVPLWLLWRHSRTPHASVDRHITQPGRRSSWFPAKARGDGEGGSTTEAVETSWTDQQTSSEVGSTQEQARGVSDESSDRQS